MKILAIIVTYFPEKELLEKNISAFINDVDRILIWENTPDEKKLEYRFIDNSKVEYCGDGINSISHALNYAWIYAKSNGYDYLLSMDQDSLLVGFSQYLKYTVYNSDAPQGIWAPYIIESEEDINKDAKGNKVIPSTITSGMLVSVPLITKIGGWNETFVIDGLDVDFCFYANRLGIKTYHYLDIYLIQSYGNSREIHFWGRNITLRNYSPQRYYSIYRSHWLLMRMYPEQKYFGEFCKCYWGGMIKWIIVFEEHRIKKLFNISRGILSGLFCTIPKRREPKNLL